MVYKKFYIKTFGCQQNIRDSEYIADYYESQGYKPAEKIEEADLIVINSCSVRQSAENRVYGLINNIKHLTFNKKQKIILTGCMLGLYGKYALAKKISGVDEFKKISDWKLRSGLSKKGYINIMTGCNNYCSYCVVPYARGKEKSRPLEDIIKEVKNLVNSGIKEITLLGQNVNSYKIKSKINPAKAGQKSKTEIKNKKVRDIETSFAILLKTLHKIPGLTKISFLTSNPWDLNQEIIEAMSLPKIDRYLHLPLQSGDDEILRKMNRRYNSKQYLELVKKIRKKIPDIKIGTDIIVGFPGESEEQFKNTVKICKKVKFVKAYIAMYSPRPKTAAFKLKDDVSYKEKKRRWQILEKLINKTKL